MSLSRATISSSHLLMFNDLNFLNGSHKKVSNYPWKMVWRVFWQNWNGVQMWHMILEHKPQHYIEVFLFCWHLYSPFTGFSEHVPVSTGTKLDHMQENSRSLESTQPVRQSVDGNQQVNLPINLFHPWQPFQLAFRSPTHSVIDA